MLSDKNPNWKGGIYPLYLAIRASKQAKLWRKTVFKRDDYACQECGDNRGHNLEAHHKIAFIKILRKNNIKTLEEAMRCKELWGINNGITLCKKCHKLKHKYKNYGYNK